MPDAPAKGIYRLQLFRRPIGEAELVARARKHETEERQASVSYVCGHCARVLLVCRLEGEPGSTQKSLECLHLGGVTPSDCERGDVVPPAGPEKSPFD